MSQKPLDGIRVIEMSTMVATPSCGRLLAYLGAEVIKVESLEGEPYRNYTAYSGKEPVVFDVLNSQKKSLVLNAKNPAAKKHLLSLIKTADIYLSNIRADSLARLGLSYEELHSLNPKLIYAHFSGYGQKGPMAKLPGYDSTSFLVRNGAYRDFTSPDREPINHIFGLGDLTAGLALTMGILGAIIKRGADGNGEQVDCSLNQVGAWVMLMPMVYEQFGSWLSRRDFEPMDVASCNMKCGDGEWIYYSCGTFKQWLSFCEAIDRTDLIGDPRCRDFTTIVQHTPELVPAIAKSFLTRSAEEWISILRSHDIACERHRHVSEMATDEQLLANGFIYPSEYPEKNVSVPAPPILYGSLELSDTQKGAVFGQYTRELLTSVGCTQEELDELIAQGAVLTD